MEFGWIPPGTKYIPPGIQPDSSRIGIQVDPSDSGGNGGNLVGIWWEFGGNLVGMNPSPGQI